MKKNKITKTPEKSATCEIVHKVYPMQKVSCRSKEMIRREQAVDHEPVDPSVSPGKGTHQLFLVCLCTVSQAYSRPSGYGRRKQQNPHE